ncbi:DUF4097 family beta strand repeat-containing protein [Halobium salinum]|uniref:DUF4097 family beta strand repeat-containing protein n=1 Tax=Halobium salinum TaxID=1364940 RepID=A0ABD5PD83_9EURY|nr:DUF4097 family beta strand repeat-containing protein [Halobium salinum]
MSLLDRFTTTVTALAETAMEESYRHTREERLSFDALAALSLATRNGRIHVRGEDRDDLRVDVTKHAREEADLDRIEVVAEAGSGAAAGAGDAPGDDGDSLALRVEHPPGVRDVAVDLDVALPRGTALTTVETENGRVDVADVTGDVVVRTKNGRVDLRDVEGYPSVETGNGAVKLAGTTGVDRVTTSNGSVDAEIRSIRGDALVETTNGRVVVRLGPTLDAEVVATSSVGSVDAGPLGGSARGVGGQRVAGTVGDGGHELGVRTDVGSVTVEDASE